ncbi:MAG: DUF2811 domain-containing protein [Cyanobacteriota bacterium]
MGGVPGSLLMGQAHWGQTPDHAPAYVSVVNEFPEDLHQAMVRFIEEHPQWDQYRLMHAALAGFLFQQGSQQRSVARHYLDGLFRREKPQNCGSPLQTTAPRAKAHRAETQRAETHRAETHRSEHHWG